MIFDFENTYARLPARFFHRMEASPVVAPVFLKVNEVLATDLGLDFAKLNSPEGLAILSGNAVAEGSEPLAQAYAGHQFGGFSAQLGDGRALLLGEILDENGRRRDLQLKGSGSTPFSRRGDGRSALGPVLREYLVSEAMHALGVPTTRALAAVMTGEEVWRQEREPGGILTRVAASHIRVGTFAYFAAKGDVEGVKILADYVIARHYPEALEAQNPYLALLENVIARQADLIAKWMAFGFIHGVMNTDNMAVSGESIDFGPCAFMDDYDPEKVFSSIDQQGRYAYRNQPAIAQWNLTRLAETLLPLFTEVEKEALEIAQTALEKFAPSYGNALRREFSGKIGVENLNDAAWDLVQDFLRLMIENNADFTLSFRHLSAAIKEEGAAKLRALFQNQSALGDWLDRWRRLMPNTELMTRVNPIYIPRNHRVEEVIRAAYQGDMAPFHRLHESLEKPFVERDDFADFELSPKPDQVVKATFCGT